MNNIDNNEVVANEDMITITMQEYNELLAAREKLVVYMTIEQQKKSEPRKSQEGKVTTKQLFGEMLKKNPEFITSHNGRGNAIAYAIATLGISKACASTYYANFKSGEWTLGE